MQDDEVRLTTESLVAGLLGRSDPHWLRLVQTYGPLVVQWTAKFGIPHADREDIAQEVFSAASKGIEKYRHDTGLDGSLRRWLWGITRNRVQRYFAELKESPRALGGTDAGKLFSALPELPFEESTPDNLKNAEQELAARAIQLIKTDFQERTWKAFWMTVIEGQTTKQVSEELDMSTNQVRQYRSRVLRQLRAEFGNDISILGR